MKKHFQLQTKIYLFLWSCITLISIFLFLRFAALSFSDGDGQAHFSWKDTIFSNVFCRAMEQSSALISYQTEGLVYAFPEKIVADRLTLADYIKNDSILLVNAQGNDSFTEQDVNWNNGEDKNQESSQETEEDNGRIRYSDVTNGNLSKEYILTNGALFASNQLTVGYVEGNVTYQETEEDEDADEEASIETINTGNLVDYTMEQLNDVNFLIRHFYIVDGSTKITDELFNAETLLGKDMTMKQESDKPQILIYHTHSQEEYADSKSGTSEDTVVGVGSYLTKVLEEEYGYNVIHDTTTYDIVDGQLDRNVAYTMAEAGIEKILTENPTIEVVIDLHRDGAEKRTTVINGEETAQIMLFNGLSRDQNGPIDYLDNPNLQDNLAFSLQLQLKSLKLYPGLFYRNYLKCYRYNMHVRKKCILMELGTNKNTLQSAKNAMKPFAEILDAVLKGE